MALSPDQLAKLNGLPLSDLRTDYSSLSSEALDLWLEERSALVKAPWPDRWQPSSEDELLLQAVISDALGDLAEDYTVVFGKSRNDLVRTYVYPNRIEVSRFVLEDWDLAFDLAMQEVARGLLLSVGGYSRAARQKMAARLGALGRESSEFVYRGEHGKLVTLSTPYGPLAVVLGVDQFSSTVSGVSGLVVDGFGEWVSLEDAQGKAHRIRAEEIHPESGDLNEIIQHRAQVGGHAVVYGESFANGPDGEALYALYRISPSKIAVISESGTRSTVAPAELN